MWFIFPQTISSCSSLPYVLVCRALFNRKFVSLRKWNLIKLCVVFFVRLMIKLLDVIFMIKRFEVVEVCLLNETFIFFWLFCLFCSIVQIHSFDFWHFFFFIFWIIQWPERSWLHWKMNIETKFDMRIWKLSVGFSQFSLELEVKKKLYIICILKVLCVGQRTSSASTFTQTMFPLILKNFVSQYIFQFNWTSSELRIHSRS